MGRVNQTAYNGLENGYDALAAVPHVKPRQPSTGEPGEWAVAEFTLKAASLVVVGRHRAIG